jgi:hypothetical protein
MRLELNELEYLKDGDIIRRKIEEVNQFFKEKGIVIEEESASIDYNKETFRFGFYVSIPLRRAQSDD